MVWSGKFVSTSRICCGKEKKIKEYAVEPCDLGSFNSTNNRNGKSCKILKLRERFFFVLGVTSLSYYMVAVEQLKVAGRTEELDVLFYFNDVLIATCVW